MTRRHAAGPLAFASALGFALFISPATPAHAQDRRANTNDPGREARAAFEQGFRAFQALDYATALPLFQRAYVLSQNAAILYNIGVTLEAMDRRAEAATAFRRFVAASPDAPNRADAEARAQRLETAAATASSGTPTVNTTVVSSASPPPVVEHPHHPTRPLWPFVAFSVGAAAAIAGVITMTLAPDPGMPRPVDEATYLRQLDASDVQRTIGGVVLGVGAAALVAGVVGVLLIPPLPTPRRDRASLRWGVAPTQGGAFVSMELRFGAM